MTPPPHAPISTPGRRPPAGHVVTAAIAALLALAISPWSVAHLTSRSDLTFRVTLVGAVLSAFLLLIAVAALAIGRARRFMLHVVALALPFVLLACLEAAAIAVNLADRIAPVEDKSVYAAAASWPGHLLSQARFDDGRGVRLYAPWRGDGIAINELGLRTDSPRPKLPGEWRIAVTGGSTVWGSYIRDADTIPVQLARALQARGYDRVTVYNFGIEGAQLASELRLLDRLRGIYALDQVLFYTGGNDVLAAYSTRVPWTDVWTGFFSLELVKAAGRVAAKVGLRGRKFDAAERDRVRRSNPLAGAITAAAAYCGAQGLRCDVVLQPWLLSRAHPAGPETRLAPGVEATVPGLAELWDAVYAGALDAGPKDHVFDLRAALDDVRSPIFADMVHVNEIGNAAIAQRLVPIVARALPQNRSVPQNGEPQGVKTR
jgi:lysophospholipase L1-like esterase